MIKEESQTLTSTGSKSIPYCDQIIIALLLVIIIAVPLYFDIHLHSVFDLSKITILYVLTFTILAVWSAKTMISRRQVRHKQTTEGSSAHVRLMHNPNSDTFKVCNNNALPLLRQPLSLPVVAFLFISGLATIFSIHPYLSLAGAYKRYGGFLSTIVYVSLFFIIIRFIDKKRLASLLNVIILTACLASVYGIVQHFGLDLYQWSTTFGYGIRVSSTFGHPAFFSAFLIMVIPLILIKIFSRSNHKYSTFLFMGILTLLLVAFYYTKTRASFIGLIVSNLFFFSLIGKKNLLANRAKTIVTIAIITGISIFFNLNDSNSVIKRFIGDIQPALSTNNQSSEQNLLSQTIIAGNGDEPEHSGFSPEFQKGRYDSKSHGKAGFTRQLEGTMFMRVFQYLTGMKIMRDYPLLGIGPETLGLIYPQYLAEIYSKIDEYRHFENQNRIHNDFLDVIVSRGLSGLGVYVWFLSAYVRMVWKGCRQAGRSDKILITGLCAGCLAYFVQNQFSFGHIPIITLFWFLIAMSVVASPVRYPERDQKTVSKTPDLTQRIHGFTIRAFGKYSLCSTVVCLMILLIVLSLFRYKADVYFEHGRKTLYKGEIPEAIQSYEMAVKYNPFVLNYRNVLNGIYLKLAATGIGKYRNDITENSSGIYSPGQSRVWLTKAIDGAEKVQKFYPEDYHSAFTLGQAYHLLDKLSDKDISSEAIKYYKRATTLHPFKFEFRNRLARLYAEKGQYENAICELENAKNISPANQASYLNLAKVFMNDNERYGEAEDVLLEFIKKNPERKIVDIHKVLSRVYFKTEQWEKLLRQSEEIFRISTEELAAYKYAIMANLELGRDDDARNLCNTILALAGQTKNIYSNYARETLELLSGN